MDSRHIEQILEKDINSLEVSSPGLDRKFFKDSQYNNYSRTYLEGKIFR